MDTSKFIISDVLDTDNEVAYTSSNLKSANNIIVLKRMSCYHPLNLTVSSTIRIRPTKEIKIVFNCHR